MKTVAIIQARMGSTRLPGKVMKMLQDKTVLSHVITRVKACPLLDEVVVATTDLAADDVIVEESARHGTPCFRGSEQDVLSRYYQAAREHNADVVVRVTSDCPLFDPDLLTRMLERFAALKAEGQPVDYMSNTLERAYPRGLDAEIMTIQALEQAHREATRPREHEHVTPYICHHPELFHSANYRDITEDLSHHRWTLDTPEDLVLLQAIFDALYSTNPVFSTADILRLLAEQPQLTTINAHVKQKKLTETG